MKTPNLQSFLRWQLRKISLRWPPRSQALARARIERGLYRCEGCKEERRSKEVAVDHIVPVVSEDGFQDWNTFIERLFCSVDMLQVLCHPCHDIKTKAENLVRKEIKNASNVKKQPTKPVRKKATRSKKAKKS